MYDSLFHAISYNKKIFITVCILIYINIYSDIYWCILYSSWHVLLHMTIQYIILLSTILQFIHISDCFELRCLPPPLNLIAPWREKRKWWRDWAVCTWLAHPGTLRYYLELRFKIIWFDSRRPRAPSLCVSVRMSDCVYLSVCLSVCLSHLRSAGCAVRTVSRTLSVFKIFFISVGNNELKCLKLKLQIFEAEEIY